MVYHTNCKAVRPCKASRPLRLDRQEVIIMTTTKKTRFSPKKAINTAAAALLERKQERALSTDEAREALQEANSLKRENARKAARAAVLDEFAGTVRVEPADIADIEQAVTAIACTTSPVHVLVAEDVVQDMRDVADGLPAGKLIAGLWGWFVQTTKPAKRDELLKSWAERPDTRDFSPENVLRVAGLWDESPEPSDEQV